VFNSFKLLKQQRRLGESNPKGAADSRKNPDSETAWPLQVHFDQVVDDGQAVQVVSEDDNGLSLTPRGLQLHGSFAKVISPEILFGLIEQNGSPFRSLIARMYGANPASPGLLVFRSTRRDSCHFDRVKFQTTAGRPSYGDALGAASRTRCG